MQRCEKCCRDKKNVDDLDLEMFLRFKISHHLKIENDNFARLFEQYKDISFNLVHINVIIDRGLESEMSVIDYFLRQKLVLGVGFRVPEFHQLAKYTTTSFSIPILKDGKMWQILFDMIRKKEHTSIDKRVWDEFSPLNPLDCLLCNDYPYGCYPGNFIVNQSVLCMRSFIWMDKHKFHVQRSNNNRIIMYKDSKIVAWPFLRDHMTGLISSGVNCLWNMAVFGPGEVFTSFVDIVISRIRNSSNQNRVAMKLQHLIEKDEEEDEIAINLDDLIDMYKYCRKKKQYEIGENRLPRLKKNKKKTINVTDIEEERIISVISSNIPFPVISHNLLNWFKFPKSKTSLGTIIHELSQMIRRGEIDIAITQTSILNKEYNSVYENNDVMNKNNLDVHRIGRFTRNAATNCFCNICGIACGLQKVLPKESKTKEPKMITNSEIGFIDLLNTPDTPRNCGLVVESVIDVLISTLSMTVNSDEIMSGILRSNFDDLQLVPNPHTLDVLFDRDTYVYICANQVLYKFILGIPKQLTKARRKYLISYYGSKNYFRMTQYVLKIRVPCIELIKESDSFWVCTSFPRTLYKIHNDGLLYTSKEIQSFEHDPETIKGILLETLLFEEDDDEEEEMMRMDDFISLWVGKNNREFIPNIFGPSIRATPKPNSTHLPRVSHSISTMKHAVGLPNNSRQIGSVHQRGLTAAYYCFKLDPSAGFILPGYYPSILVAGGWNNQEDGIVVKKSSIDRGMFLANCYETAAVKVNYGLIKSLDSKSNIFFVPTIAKGDILRPGIRVGIFRNFFCSYYNNNNNNNNTNSNKDSLIELFSPELKLQYDEDHFTISILWMGKQPVTEFEHNNKPKKCEFSMAYVESHPISCANDNIRCENLECIDVKHMKHLKLYLTYSYQFTPTVGDKLQTPTSQKGVITELVGDEDMPYILLDNGDCLYPDMLINPHFLKRQTFDNLYLTGFILNMNSSSSSSSSSPSSSSSLHMNNCFSYSLKDTMYYIGLGEKLATGKVMNPITGLPYLRPVHKREPGVKYYCPPNPEYVDSHGFTCIDKSKASGDDDNSPHEIVRGSIFFANYYNVNNHKASAMMHSSKGDEIIRTDFSGAPVRGKKGGFSTGPQEHLALAGMGMERFNAEISHMRSDFCGVEVYPVEGSKKRNYDGEILGASSTFMRINDDINLRNKNVIYDITKHVDVRQKKNL